MGRKAFYLESENEMGRASGTVVYKLFCLFQMCTKERKYCDLTKWIDLNQTSF